VIGIADDVLARRGLFRGMIGGGITAANVMLFSEMSKAEATTAPGADAGSPTALKGGAKVPRVYTRKEWGAVKPDQPISVLGHAPDHIIVHHTASPNATDTSLAHALQLSRDIQKFHMDTRKWGDIGEQLTISRGGYVMEGRSRSLETIKSGKLVEGAQCLHNNDHTIGIENEGTYLKVEVPDKLWKSLVSTCTWLCLAYKLDPQVAILGHRDYNQTDCPGDVLYGRLPELRRQVAEALGLPIRMGEPPLPTGPAGQVTFDHGPAGDTGEQ
jgi:N-acetylmuramoyl-L-alanine amidase